MENRYADNKQVKKCDCQANIEVMKRQFTGHQFPGIMMEREAKERMALER